MITKVTLPREFCPHTRHRAPGTGGSPGGVGQRVSYTGLWNNTHTRSHTHSHAERGFNSHWLCAELPPEAPPRPTERRAASQRAPAAEPGQGLGGQGLGGQGLGQGAAPKAAGARPGTPRLIFARLACKAQRSSSTGTPLQLGLG